jgi:uncharacterized membrane protein YciS (DUF1049 family)
MSDNQPSKREMKESTLLIILFAVGFGVGAATYGLATNATFQHTLKASIGVASGPTQFGVGSWFRYDGIGYTPENDKIYIITNITGTTTAGAANGNAAVNAVAGNIPWYTWSVKVYWDSGTEAIELYNFTTGGSKIPYWDDGARYLVNAYKDRNSFSGNALLDSSKIDPAIQPMLVPDGRYKEVSFPSGYTQLSGSTQWIFLYRHINSTNDIEAIYDKDTWVLTNLIIGGSGLPTEEFELTGWSINTPVATTLPQPSLVMQLSKGTGTSAYSINFQLTNANKIDLNITSSNTTDFANVNSTLFNNAYPVSITSPVTLTVYARAYTYPAVKSSWVKDVFVLNATNIGKQVNSTTVSATTVGSSIHLAWTSVANATSYRIFVDGSYFDTTTDTTYDFRPGANGTYAFYIICDSLVLNVPSNKSNTASATFGKTRIFAGTYATQAVAPADQTTLIIVILTVGALVAGGIIGLYYLRCSAGKKKGKDIKGCPTKYRSTVKP